VLRRAAICQITSWISCSTRFSTPGVLCIRIHRIFIAVQQLGDLGSVGYIRSGAMSMVSQARLRIGADMRLQSG
jgi:hypothetical protein